MSDRLVAERTPMARPGHTRSVKILVAGGTAAAALLAFEAAAGACTGYQWAGKDSSSTWNGVAAGISQPTESLPNDTGYHALNYVDMNSVSGDCNGLGACWIQIGNLEGYVAGSGSAYCEASSPQIYVEDSDYYAYDCTQYKGTITPASDDYYTEFYTGTCGGPTNDLGLVDAEVYNGSQYYLIGQAWLPSCSASYLYAQSEFDEFGGTGCPSLSQYEGFGGSPWPLEQYNAISWTDWTSGLTHGPNSPLNVYPNPTNGYTSFLTWG